MLHEPVLLAEDICIQRVRGDLAEVVAGTRELSRADIFEMIERDGGILFTDTNLTSGAMYSQFLQAIGFRHVSYVGGTTPRRTVARDVYTATEIAPEARIRLHQEKAYSAQTPDFISFFCCSPPDDVQKTNVVGDMRRVTARFPAELRRKYAGRSSRLRRLLPPQGGNVGAFRNKRCWEDTLGTTDRAEAEELAARNGWTLRWTEDDFLEITHEPVPLFREHPVHGTVFCNQAFHYQPVANKLYAQGNGYGDAFEHLTDAQRSELGTADVCVLDDGSPVPLEDTLAILKLLDEESRSYRLKRGEVIILDNLLMGHGRNPFTGERQMFTAIGERA